MTAWPRPRRRPSRRSACRAPGSRAVRPSGATPTQLMPGAAGHAPRPTACRPPRRAAPRTCRWPPPRGLRPAAREQRRRQLRLLLGQVGAGQAARRYAWRRRPASVDAGLPARPPGSARRAVARRRRRRAARGDAPGPRSAASSVPSAADEGHVGLAVAAVDREHGGLAVSQPASGCRHAAVRPRTGTARSPRSAGRPSASARSYCPTSGCASSADSHPVAGRRAARRRPRAPRTPTRARPARAAAARSGAAGTGTGAAAADHRGHLDHRLVGEERQRAVVAHVDDLHVPAVAEQRREQRDRGLGVERAAPLRRAAPACCRAPGRRTSAAARARSPRPPPPVSAAPAARRPPRRARRSSAGSTRARRQDSDSSGEGSPMRPAISSPCPASSSGSLSLPSTSTARSQVRWFRPDVVKRHRLRASTPSSDAK